MFKKSFFLFIVFTYFLGSLLFSQNYPDIINFIPYDNSFQVEYLPNVSISFTLTNSPSEDFAILVDGEWVVSMLANIGTAAGKVNTNSGFKINETYDINQDLTSWTSYSTGSNYYFYCSLTNFSWFGLHSGQRITVDIITSSNISGNPPYITNSFSFVLKDIEKPQILLKDNSGNTVLTDSIFSNIQIVTLSGLDNSEEDVCVYYTIDGSEPDYFSSSFLNQKTMYFNSDVVVKAFGVDISGNSSDVIDFNLNINFSYFALQSMVVVNSEVIRSDESMVLHFREDNNYFIQLITINGRQVYNQEFAGGPSDAMTLDLEQIGVSEGVYIVRVTTDDGLNRTFKILFFK